MMQIREFLSEVQRSDIVWDYAMLLESGVTVGSMRSRG